MDESPDFDQVVIVGEGGPTLRMDALLAFAKTSPLLVRLITNGLCYSAPNFGYLPYNTKRDGVIMPMHRHMVLRDMLEAVISCMSVVLNTANRQEYDVLMEPCCHVGKTMGGGDDGSGLMPSTAHDLVCEFIMEAARLGMGVEITVIDRPGIDRVETDPLARMLLSVGPDKGTLRDTVAYVKVKDDRIGM